MAEIPAGNLYIVAAPSGGGKTSLVNNLVTTLTGIEVSISHTTRSKRPGESHGVDYFFIDNAAFSHMVQAGEFIEHALVFDHFYGTSSAQIQQRLQAGIDVVLDIDWQGAQQIRQIFPNATTIFVIPPSIEVLKQRLLARKQDHDEIIRERMRRARAELSHYSEFDYLIVNDVFEQAAHELQAIVMANRLRLRQQVVKQKKLLSLLLDSE